VGEKGIEGAVRYAQDDDEGGDNNQFDSLVESPKDQ
jgi:hypothetical protein